VQDEFERLQNKKRENQEKMLRWKAENEANLELKEKQRRQQQEDDIAFARKAQRALEEKEEKRLAELAEVRVSPEADTLDRTQLLALEAVNN
jgi:hypothetical protein